MLRFIFCSLALIIALQIGAQEQLTHKQKTYTSPEGKLYINKNIGAYLWLSTSPNETSKKYRLWSEETKAYSNPMYFDTDGYNTVRSPSCIDTTTRKLVYPMRDIIFEVYADGAPPKTKINFGNTKTYPFEGKINLGTGTSISLSATDRYSGVENIYYSIDEAPYKPYTAEIKIEQEKEYVLKYYAVDNVGNVEAVHSKTLVFDKTAPVSKLEIDGDKHEAILSARSKIVLSAEDKGIGVKTIYYKLDEGAEKTYKSPIPAAYILQDDHAINYYSVDRVGNKEQAHTYNFYVDKTPPTIIEEVMGKSFFSGGKEFSSGKSRLKLTSFDNKAGVKEIRYSVNDGEYKEYDKPVFLTQSSGVLSIKTYAVDNVNNRSSSQVANQKTNIPYIDLTGPELSYAFKGSKFKTRDTLFINTKTSIILKGADSESGINRIEYSLNNATPIEFDNGFTIKDEGYSAIDYTGFDNVDNTSSKSFGVKIDNTGPQIDERFGTSALRKEGELYAYPSHTVLFLTATDNVVGLQRITYALNSTAAIETTGMLKGLPKGKHSMKITAYDKLGNTTEKTLNFIIE